MKLETYFEKFDLLADAPDAVTNLRDVVYSVGLAAEKWPHEPLESVALKVTDGTHQTPRYVESGIPFVSVKDFSGGSLDMSATRFITPEEHSEIYKRCDPKRGDILLGRIGTIGKAVVVDTDVEFSLFVSAAQIRPDQGKILSRYLQYVLNSPFCRAQFDNIKVGGATHTNKLNLKNLRSVRIPLPPLAEQKRIVAKVDELMALCDRLEEQQQERETRHAALARASLARFADAPTPSNLPLLFHPSFVIPPADLRKTIFTLAVQGKLVPQDTNDEPAEELIDRIAEIRHGGIAQQYLPVTKDEAPYELPCSWMWVRLGNISLTSDSGWSPQCLPEPRSGSDWGVLKVSSVSWGVFKPAENKALPPGMPSRPACEVKPGDFLISRANTEELVARSVVVNQTPPGLMMSDKIVRFTFPDEVEKAYVNLANMSCYSRAYYTRNASGTSSSMKNVGRGVMCNLPIPLPPLAEQRRIVSKVEQLTALITKLESQLASSQVAEANLLASVVAELIAKS
jgi:type I restriction enzyme S subunit